MAMTFLSDLMVNLNERGWNPLARPRGERRDLVELCDSLLSRRGEISCYVLSEAILEGWEAENEEGRVAFLRKVADRFGPDREAVETAVERLRVDGGRTALHDLHRASEPRSQELIRRLNHANQGTRRLVKMRETLLSVLYETPELRDLDADFAHLFASWFNRGFLELRPINWATSANVLEKIILHEAVHEIAGWDDLRRRIEPADRRLFAFFHPQIPDEPLIFVEVALTDHVPGAIAPLLAGDRAVLSPDRATTAVFYSISNCQTGLRGISFGNLLIKQVVESLKLELPNLRTFVTLSPVPGLRAWIDRTLEGVNAVKLSRQERELLSRLEELDDGSEPQVLLEGLAARYLLEERNARDLPADPVARFHLGNGARLDNIHAFADLSPKGRESGCSVMVNYTYDNDVEANHEAYAERGAIASSNQVKNYLRAFKAVRKNLESSNSDYQQDHVT